MKTYDIKDREFELKKAIIEGKLSPTDVVDTVVWAQGKKIEIRINDHLEDSGNLKETVIFFWDYSGKRPFMVKETEVRNNCITLEQNKTLMLQMQLLQLGAVRVGVAFRFDNAYFCGYFRNMEAKDEKLQLIDRSICKLESFDQQALVAYWTEGGILSVMVRNEQKFDNEFYRARLSEYYWENGNLVAYTETPLIAGEAEIGMLSTSTNMRCANASVSMENAAVSGLKRIWKMTIDLSCMPADDSDGYRVLCNLGGHSFGIYFDGETDDDALCRIMLKSGETLDLCVIKEKNDRFILKTGKIYPVMLSVVTAVYNTAPFLAEMINSVLSQDVSVLEEQLCEDYRKDYYQNIYELILVDDGSTDGSADILNDYAQLSDRIKVIHKENGGVSSARNAGIDTARGKYINFADSDDKWESNAFNEVLSFFEKNYDEISLAVTPVWFFDALDEAHWLNYRFGANNSVVDLTGKVDFALSSVNCVFFKTELIGSNRFDITKKIAEDMLFVNEYIMRSGHKVGAVSKTKYMYRRRSTGEASAMDLIKCSDFAYYPVAEGVFLKLLLEAKETYGYIPKFIQFTVMSQLQWRFSSPDKGERETRLLGNDGYRQYKELCISILKYIDDDVILKQKKIWSENHFDMLSRKYNCKPAAVYENGDIFFDIKGVRITTSVSRCYIRLDFLKIEGNILHIEGYGMNYIPDIKLLIKVNGKEIKYNSVDRDANKYSFDYIVYYATTFSADIPLERSCDKTEISFWGKYNEIEVEKKAIRYSKTMPLSSAYDKSYYLENNWAIRQETAKIIVYNMEKPYAAEQNFEAQFTNQVKASKSNVSDVLDLRNRALYQLAMKPKNRKIWLISDRVNAANDNGEAFFRFINTLDDPSIEAYFVIGRDSVDFERMREFGNVVEYGSRQHLQLQLMADYIISSAGDEQVVNPWHQKNDEAEVMRDLLARPKFIFLQHGVTMNDLSSWLDRYNKNITGFICTAPREAQSILDYKYYYKPENVWLTGFPRHDRLYHDEKRYVTIMPTWRKWLADGKNSNQPTEGFTGTDYFNFYNGLLNNRRLLDAAKKYNYTICFKPHPNVQTVINLFDRNNEVKFFDQEKTYSEIYAESDLVMTDYSSACMDFALLKKPIVFCQFDEQQFFENHTVKHGYYDYEQDGFGEVTYDMESLIDVTIDYMKNGCKVHEPYASRMNKFFAFHDHNNCERVYRKIKELDQNCF